MQGCFECKTNNLGHCNFAVLLNLAVRNIYFTVHGS